MPSLLRTDKEIIAIYDRHVDTVYRICYSFMKNAAEAEDMVQETFLRLIVSSTIFRDERHERAWLIVTASNLCKDSLKKWWRRNESIEDNLTLAAPQSGEQREVMEALLQIPKDYKAVVYMYYYEGYSTAEIASWLNIPHATVRTRLARARKQLRNLLGGDA